MLSRELLTQLQKLNRMDKLRVVQILVNDLAQQEESLLTNGRQYEIWSPYDSGDDAAALLKMLSE